MEQMTITELSRFIAEVYRWDREAQDKVHRQIRHWNKEGFISPDQMADARGTALFEVSVVFKIRLLLLLADIGLDSEDFRSALYNLEPPADGVIESIGDDGKKVSTPFYNNPQVYERHFDSVIKKIRAKEPWHICVVFKRDRPGNRMVQAFFLPSGKIEVDEIVDDIKNNPVYISQNLRLQAVALINFAEIIEPLTTKIGR